MFQLDLSATCMESPDFGAGVQDSFCFIGFDPGRMLDTEEKLVDTTSSTTTPSRSIRRRLQDDIFQPYNFTAANSEQLPPDYTPVVIYSIYFEELDTNNNIIQSERRPVVFQSGSTFSYTSISDGDPSVVVGSMHMVLAGRNSASDLVLNVFKITYTNDCGIPTIENGDTIGWVVFENLLPASEETCPSWIGQTFLQPNEFEVYKDHQAHDGHAHCSFC
ncbi:hypothetical protein ACHAXH_006756 [Discostella pseudostelligera]